MIALDYVKLYLQNININRLLQLPQLTFISKTSQQGKEYKIAKYNFCTIKIYPSTGGMQYYVVFAGSLHKMWNELQQCKAPNFKNDTFYKGYNGNQFALTDMYAAMAHLQMLFDCAPAQMEIKGIEFNITLKPPFKVNQYLKGLLIHMGVAFKFRYRKHFAVAEHSLYNFKIYNKAAMYSIAHPMIRVELKIKRMLELKNNNIDITSMADINNATMQQAFLLLIKRFDEVLHYDHTINTKQLTKTQLKQIVRYSSPMYWQALNAKDRHRPKKALKQIIKNHSANQHSYLLGLLKAKQHARH